MSAWWEALSLREKGLIGAAGLLVGILVIWYGLVSPSLAARDAAAIERQTAAAQLSRVEQLAAAVRARSPAQAAIAVSTATTLGAEAFKTEVTREAQAAGLSIARLQGADDGRFSMVFEQADPRQLFYFLSLVETQLGGRVERLSMDKAGNGRVRATVELSGGGA
ncbi:MAG: type II secretion system protein GspM [Henriciella sp.]|uniref:type II secretion system protein GspM n=1 Tax=Henriciella sp. TaxID=1968823 RepID=UPI003C75FF3A